MARVTGKELNQALALVRASARIGIFTHVGPDGDTIGSALALAHGLRQLGHRTVAYSVDEPPANLAFLPGYDELRRDLAPAKHDLLVLVDSDGLPRFGLADPIDASPPPKTLNLDHHATNSRCADVNVVDPSAAATGELVFDFLKALGVKITSSIAICLLTTLVTDTRVFRTANTTPRTLSLAGELFAKGAPLNAIVNAVYYNRPFTTVRLWGAALAGLQLADGVAWTEITEEMQTQLGATPGEGDGVIDLLSSIAGVRAVALFRENNGDVKVSLRSTDDADVGAVAALFGGGGHPRAAGSTVPGRLGEVREGVLRALREQAARP
ncbi:MAG: DHH family phosphoesterase [Chloroflexota bacterium]